MHIPKTTRRNFLSTACTTGLFFPNLLLGKKGSEKQIIVGTEQYKFEAVHNWAKLPDKYTWQTTHNLAVDQAGFVYVIHEGRKHLIDHPSIFVFDPDGKFVRAFGSQFQGGGHGIEVRKEGNEEFLYVCAYQNIKAFAKLTLNGEVVWEKYAPMQSGVYKEGEDKEGSVRLASKNRPRWGRDAFLPTNFAFLRDGGFLLSDGYGSFWIHRYDKEGNWLSKFGGPGKGQGTFKTPHGIWVDDRNGKETVVICDRAHHTIQFLDLEGRHVQTINGFGLPANADSWQDLLMIPELHARISLLDKSNKVVARLGDDVENVVTHKKVSRGNSKTWKPGKFVHPHDACFSPCGDIFVAEWVQTGRISKLRRIS
tara:strand:- start:1477 stop:2577 length:1101 start_codon:yes stop_codon:yes gene_type:complete